MADEKKFEKADTVVKPAYGDGSTEAVVDTDEVYDPSKESIWTRLGLNFESYKRAPGSTR